MSSKPVNADQIAYWNGPSGQRWAEQQETLDESLKPMAEAALRAASPVSGEVVLDIGCGTGATTLMLADAVGPSGSATGVDISQPMLAVAQGRAEGRANVRFVEADASVYPFEADSADLVFSRFGVMFFEEPGVAFTNLHRALKPGGRIAFVCWRPLKENPFALVPMAAALKHLPPQPPGDPDAPGPFGLGNRDRTALILAEAGFAQIGIEPFDGTMKMAHKAETAAKEAVYMGMASRLLKDADQATKDKVVAELTDTYARYLTPDGVIFPAHTWIVTARA